MRDRAAVRIPDRIASRRGVSPPGRTMAIGLCLLLIVAGLTLAPSPLSPPARATHPDVIATTGDPVVVAAGDIARIPAELDATSGNVLVSDLILGMNPAPDLVLTLGDNQYGGTLANYNAPNAFNASWGRFKGKIRPTLGDEDAQSAGNYTGYYDYFNTGNDTGPAGERGKGYYSFDVGTWHVVVLNAQESVASDGAQAAWLRQDLAVHPTDCTLATLHVPRFSSNSNPDSNNMEPLVETLHSYGVDIVMGGDVHSYERFANQNPAGGLNEVTGIRQYIVGTGGHSTGALQPDAANSQARGNMYGVLELTLRPTSYEWRFLAVDQALQPTNTVQEEQGGADNCVAGGGRPAPTVSSVDEAALAPGLNGIATVKGSNFTSSSTLNFGPGVTTVDVDFVSSTQLTAAIAVAPQAQTGTRTVTATNPGGLTGTCTTCFAVASSGTTTPAPKAGYWLVAADGGIFAFGDARFHGSTGNLKLVQPIAGMATTPGGGGYWLVARDGGIFAFGDARFHGSTGNLKLAQPIVGMAPTPTGGGYWLVARDGGIFAFGDARFHGSTGNLKLAQPIVGMAATSTGGGYVLVAADGGIFAFGDARFNGSTGNLKLAKPIVGMAQPPAGNGYWLVASDGGIFAFGDARFHGSTGNQMLNQPIVSMAPTPSGFGYWMTASDGGIFNFGDASFEGSAGALKLTSPIVGMTPTK